MGPLEATSSTLTKHLIFPEKEKQIKVIPLILTYLPVKMPANSGFKSFQPI